MGGKVKTLLYLNVPNVYFCVFREFAKYMETDALFLNGSVLFPVW